MKHKKLTFNRLTVLLLAIIGCIAMLFGAVFNSFRDYAAYRATLAAAADGDGETPTPDHTYELKSIDVAIADGWIFTQNTPESMLYKMVTISVTYNNVKLTPNVEDTYSLVLTGETGKGGAYVSATGETITFSAFSATASNVSFTVTVEPKEGKIAEGSSNEKQCTFTCNEGARQQNGIYAEYDEGIGATLNVTSGTNIGQNGSLRNAINVYPTYNDGTRGDTADPQKDNYTLSGNFFPEEFTAECQEGYVYDKAITVSTNAEPTYSTTVVWKNVKFELPYGILRRLSGTLADQYARSEFDMSGLTVQLDYDAGGYIEVPLSAFKNYLTIAYYTGNDEGSKVDSLTRAVTRIIVTVNYPFELEDNQTATGTFTGVEVRPLHLHVPSFPNIQMLTYNEGASIDIGNWDYNTLYPATSNLTSPEITITADYDISVPDLTSDPQDGIVTVDFNQAGLLYTLTVSLDPDGDFDWVNPPNGNVTKPNGDNFKLQFIIQVDKGKLEVEISELTPGGAELTYGQQNNDGTLDVKIKNTDPQVELDKSWTLESTVPTDWHVHPLNTWQYHLEYYKTQGEAEAAKSAYEAVLEDESPSMPAYKGIDCSGLQNQRPKDAGTYYVIAVLHENIGYLAAVSNVKPFTINPFEVETDVEPSKTFERTTWKIDDFLSGNQTLPYNNEDDIKDILSITSGAQSFTYAAKYSITVEISADYANNYKLEGGVSSKVLSFEILTNESSWFKAKASGWLYGTTGAAPSYTIDRSDIYYPSNTKNLATDFTFKYFEYKGAITDNPTSANEGSSDLPSNYNEWLAGTYLVKITANAAEDGSDQQGKTIDKEAENAQLAKGETVSYVLPVVYTYFTVTAAPIDAPYLNAPWTFNDEGAEEGLLTTYLDSGNGTVYTLQRWIGDGSNTAVDGSAIITVTIQYTLWDTKNSVKTVTDFTGGNFTVKYAGHYTVTIELNPNYAWDTNTLSALPDGCEIDFDTDTYSFIGYVARQELDALTGVEGDQDTYNGTEQTKTVNGWHAYQSMQIFSVEGKTIGGANVTKGITWPDTASYDNTFKVVNAGDYTVWVKIADKDNYVWKGAETGKETDDVSLKYSLKQADLIVEWVSEGHDLNGSSASLKGTTGGTGGTDYWQFMFNGDTSKTQYVPSAVATVAYLNDGKYDKDNIKVTGYAFHKDGIGVGEDIKLSGVNAKGIYYVVVTGFEGEAAANYKLPAAGTSIGTVFELTAYTFSAPMYQEGVKLDGKQLTETYDGLTRVLSNYVSNYEYYNVGGDYRIGFTVDKGTDVRDADTYTVTVVINDANFAWENGAGPASFTITIEQLMVTFTWVNLTVTYGDGLSPQATISNIQPGDSGKLFATLGYETTRGGQDLSVAPTNAGKYFVYATLTGEAAKNYKIVTRTEENTNSNDWKDYIIQKKAVTKPTLPSGEDEKFNGVQGSQSIGWNDNYDDAGVQIVISGKVPKSWFTSNASELTINPVTLTFSKNTAATFTYTRAGIYTYEVSLNAQNYYWDGDQNEQDFNYAEATYSYAVGSFSYDSEGKAVLGAGAFMVNRVALTAPDISSQRAQEWDKETKNPSDVLEINFKTASANGLTYSVLYGKAGGEADSSDWLGYEGNTKQGAQGIYFAELTLDKSQFINNYDLLLNYVWVAHPNDKNENGSDYLSGNGDEFYYEYITDGSRIAIRIYYAITKGQLDLELHVKNYIFGDNGFVYNYELSDYVEGWAKFDPSATLDVITEGVTVYLTGSEGSLAAIKEEKPTIVSWSIKRGTVELDKEEDLEHNLPWEPGTYTLLITLRFGDEENEIYEPRGLEAEFTVSARTVTKEMLTWTDTTAEYDTQSHLAKATLGDIVKRKDKNDATNYSDGIDLIVKWEDSAKGPVNANKEGEHYTVRVASIDGDTNGRFALPEKDLTAELTITPKNITIKGRPVEDHVYGDEIALSEMLFDFLDGSNQPTNDVQYTFFNDGATDNVLVEIRSFLTGSAITGSADVSATAYYVYVAWKNANDVSATNYNVKFLIEEGQAAQFVIIQRELVISWDSGNASKVYGTTTVDDLYDLMSVTYTNGAKGDVNEAFFGDTTPQSVISLIAWLTEEVAFNTETPIGVYTIKPSAKSTNWKITFTDGDNWNYTITPAKIVDTNNTLTPKSNMRYMAQNQTVFERSIDVTFVNRGINYASSTWEYGFVNSASETENSVTKWTDIKETKNVSVYNAGEYFLYIKITADNHDPFIQKLTFTVAKQTLSVKFDFTIMYGEDLPSARQYQWGIESIRSTASGWTVAGGGDNPQGFWNNDRTLFYSEEDFYGLDGAGQYTVQGFTGWDWNHAEELTTYTIVYSGTPLTCKNYDFIAVEGTLTVIPISITVKGLTVNVTYNQDKDTFPAYTTETVGYKVEHPVSSYGDGTYQPASAPYTSLIKVSSDAFDKPVTGSTTAGVGNHTLKVEQQTSSYIYSIKFENGTVVVSAAELHKYNVEDYVELYDELYHGLKVDGNETVFNNAENSDTPWRWNEDAFKKASDGTAVTVEFWEVNRSYSLNDISDDLLYNTLKDFQLTGGKLPVYIDCGTHYIIYRISAENYETVYGCKLIQINQSKNELKQEFKFANATVYGGQESTDTQIRDVQTAAWIYGYGAENGFEVDGKHAITNPVALYYRASAGEAGEGAYVALQYELWYYTTVSGGGSLVAGGDYKDVSALFADMFANGKFNAGYYRLDVFMTLPTNITVNFTFDTVQYYFRVEKRELHVKVADASTIYGEEAPEFTPAHTGLVKNSSAANAQADSIEKALRGNPNEEQGKTPNFITEYKPGKSVGGGTEDKEGKGRYYIRVDDDRVAYDGALNYYVTYDDAWLTVTQREITIKIENKTSTYNDKSSVQELTFTVSLSGGKLNIYEAERDKEKTDEYTTAYTNANQTLLTLYTQALVEESDGSWNTNHVYYDENDEIGGYTIYAVFNGNNKINYVVKFDGCSAAEGGKGVIPGKKHEPIGAESADTTKNAGLYTIKQAHVDIVGEDVCHLNDDGQEVSSRYYSGAENYYKAYLDDPDKTPIDFTYLRSEDGTEFGTYVSMNGEKPKEVGWYRAVGTSTSKDYYNGSMTIKFEIKPAEIEITAKIASVQYGTYLSGNANDDNVAGGAEQTGLFTGFNYTVHSKYDILKEILEDYVDRGSGLVTYQTGYLPNTPAGTSKVEITPVCADTKNLTFTNIGATLTIEKRQIQVTMVGWDADNEGDASKHNPWASSPYLGTYADLANALAAAYREHKSSFIYTAPGQDTFGASGDSYDDLNISLELDSRAKDFGTYSMSRSYSSNNYAITFLDDGSPKFAVLKASLTLYANDMQQAGVARSYNIVYGESVSLKVKSDYETESGYDRTLRFAVRGMVYDEVLTDELHEYDVQFVITLKDDPAKTDYVPWMSTVDQTYVVSIVPLKNVFTNYVITSYIDAELTISQRPITAKVENQNQIFTFGENVKDYHGGAEGINHVAEITFADAHTINKQDTNVNTNYRPVFSLKYSPKGQESYQSDAPKTVGEYDVKVTLNEGSNYKFADGDTTVIYYNIIQMTVSAGDLTWTDSPIHVTADQTGFVFNSIDKYQAGYLQVTNFLFEPTSGTVTEIKQADEETAGCYYFDSNGKLHIKLDTQQGIYGRYTVRIELLSTAEHNIQLLSGKDVVTFVTATFIVSTNKVTMEISFSDFVYGSDPNIDKNLTVTINGNETDNVMLRYALIKDSEAKVLALYNASKSGGLTGKDIEGLNYDSLTISTNFVSGYYLMSVYSAEWATTGYYVFHVDKKGIDAPMLTGELSAIYDGKNKSITASYSVAEMNPVFSGDKIASGNSVTFTVLNANTYYIQFVLVDSANTQWNEKALGGGEVSGDTITFTWTVAKDTTENDDTVLTVPKNVDNMVYGDTYKGTIRTANGYNGTLVLYYMPKTGDSPSGQWYEYFDQEAEAYKRLGAGSYWLKVELLETDNYAQKTVVREFTINALEIYASVSGTITYGDDLSATRFVPTISGLLSGDENVVTLGEYTYSVVGVSGKLNAGTGYVLVLDTQNGVVVNIDAGSNYVVRAIEGTLTVERRNVTVIIESMSSDYTVTPDLTQAKLSIDEANTPLAPGEDISVLEIGLKTDADNRANVGSYWIMIDTANESNYVISYQRALYTINPLTIEITLVPQTDIFYEDTTNIYGATYDKNKITTSNPAADLQYVKEHLDLKLRYSGMSYGGVPYLESDKAPYLAGVYTAQVTGAGDNYVLAGAPSVEFTIQKKVVYSSTLEIANQTYTGSALTPVLGVKEGQSGSILALVNAESASFTDAGTYRLTVTLKDAYNYQWDSTQDAYVTVSFTIDKANDDIIGEIVMSGWVYGCYSAEDNSPSAQVKSGGTVTFEYSTDGVNFSNIVPDTGSVGTYYVRFVVAESANYNAYTSEPVAFNITKYYLPVPTIVQSDGTFTGSELSALINNYDARYMAVMAASEARTFVDDANITAVAVNAGVYKIYISIIDFTNCGWMGDEGDNTGVLTLTWEIGKMKVELPTAGRNSFVVNGKEIVYIPDGFDESIMAIEHNAYSYGGNFVAVVTLKDTSNYMWADGSTKVELKWHITGENTLFVIIISVLAVCMLAAAAGLITQSLVNKHRKRTEAEALAAIESKDTPEATEGAQEGKAEDTPASETSEENANEGGNE